MEKQLQAVYKNGVLQPLEPLSLEEMQQVKVTITDSSVIVLQLQLNAIF
jgi:predicted DNA-binding antitoxin AbrB/MazE fold protein